MSKIKDIRYYREVASDALETRRSCEGCIKKESLAPTNRLIFKLREIEFSFKDKFDHLYVNFTTRLKEEQSEYIDNLSIYKYDGWLRYVDYGISEEDYQSLNTKSGIWVLNKVKTVLIKHFCETKEEIINIEKIVNEIIKDGEQYSCIYKQKNSTYGTVNIKVQVLDYLKILPTIEILDTKDNLVLVEKLEPIDHYVLIQQFSTITMNKKSVTIKPRKNAFSEMYKDKYGVDIIKLTLS